MGRKIFLRYGAKNGDLDELASELATVFAAKFEVRNSSYLGGDYYLARSVEPSAGSLKLHTNIDPIDGSYIRSEHPEYAVILHVDDVLEEEKVTAALLLTNFTLINRSELD